MLDDCWIIFQSTLKHLSGSFLSEKIVIYRDRVLFCFHNILAAVFSPKIRLEQLIQNPEFESAEKIFVDRVMQLQSGPSGVKLKDAGVVGWAPRTFKLILQKSQEQAVNALDILFDNHKNAAFKGVSEEARQLFEQLKLET